jgi:dolichol-phosphate mannosyltransferase
MQIVIILPVYNEAEGIAGFLQLLKKYVTQIHRHQIGILVFDSNSSDNTREIVQKCQENWPQLLLLTEKQKTGLGSAYLQAMRYAIDHLGADVVFQCDADGSHHPQYISTMIELIEAGNDVVVGSRYIPGGAIDADWAWYRHLISAAGNIIARTVLSWRYKDYTAGFKAIRSSALKPILDKKFFSKNYAFQINLLWNLHQANVRIIETPIKFTDREKGYSKFPRNNIMESLYVLFMLKITGSKNYFKMCCCGLLGFFIQMALFNILRIELTAPIASAIAIETAIITNFFSNNFFSFSKYRLKRHYPLRHWLKKFFFFWTISHGSMLLQIGVLLLGNRIFGSSIKTDNILIFIGIMLGTLCNYVLYKKLVWIKTNDQQFSLNYNVLKLK